MTRLDAFDEVKLRAVCDVLGATDDGLTGSEIGQLLRACGIHDVDPASSKRQRLFSALQERQNNDHCGNHVAGFIQAAMDPARYTGAASQFEYRRGRLNEVLGFVGLQLGADGRLRTGAATRTLAEVEARTNRLRTELLKRQVHPDVLRFCIAELLADDYFHAVLEAAKSVADKIRQKARLSSDGAALVDEAFGFRAGGLPILAFNSLQNQSEKSEQTGLMFLMKGLFSAFRNPTAHEPKVAWPLSEQDAIDVLSLVSLLHRRLDAAVCTRPGSLS